jgi:oligopeptide transport system substrate-binding protein
MMVRWHGNILRMCLTGWPLSMAPQSISLTNEVAPLMLNYEGLTRIDTQLRTIPGAAERWTYNADSTAITFKLRGGLTYSDGTPLKATDFVAAVRRTLDPRNHGAYQTIFDMVLGADHLIDTPLSIDDAELVARFNHLAVQAPDERTINITFNKPCPYFHTLASMWVMYPVKQALIDRGGSDWHTDPRNHIGNGPFQIVMIDPLTRVIEYKANHQYWAGPPPLRGVQLVYIDDEAHALEAYRRGDIDVMRIGPISASAIQGDSVLCKGYREYAGACTWALAFNLTKPPFDDQRIRAAFAYAFDRNSYIRDVANGGEVETLTWIPSGYPGHDPNEKRFAFDPAQGRYLLTEAGYAGGYGLPDVKLSYGTDNSANSERAAYVIDMYRNYLNVTIMPDPVEDQVLGKRRMAVETFPQFLLGAGWCADYPDPQNWVSTYWHSRTNIAKSIGYSNTEVDSLLEQADIATEPTIRLALYMRAQELIVGDVAHIIRASARSRYLIQPYVRNIESTAQDWLFPGQVTRLARVTMDS